MTFGGVTTSLTGVENVLVSIKDGDELKGLITVAGAIDFSGEVILEAKSINVNAPISLCSPGGCTFSRRLFSNTFLRSASLICILPSLMLFQGGMPFVMPFKQESKKLE